MKRRLNIFLFVLLLFSGCGMDVLSGIPVEVLSESPSGVTLEVPSETPSENLSETPTPASIPESPTPLPSQPPSETSILVSILGSKGFTVENNNQYIEPGEDAVFLLRMGNF